MGETATTSSVTWSRVFVATPPHVPEARRFLARILVGRSAADDAVLCLGELAANAAIHSRSRDGGQFTVRAQLGGGILRVEVGDEGGPWVQPAGPPDGQHGRGLLIVSQLTRAWGRSGGSDTGWTVWYEIDCP